MGQPVIQTNFVTGELCPALWGRTDLDKYHSAAAVMRNFFVDYRSGATSRPGSAFVGFAGANAMTGNVVAGAVGAAVSSGGYTPAYNGFGNGVLNGPSRLIPFQFSATETYVIEMGAGFFRFIFQGAYVLEPSLTISTVTSADPGVVVTASDHGYSTNDLIFVAQTTGLAHASNGNSGVNGRFFYASVTGPQTFNLIDPITGDLVDTSVLSAFVSGGVVARVYTIANPYRAADLRRIKYCQSGDTMTLTHVSYPAATLVRDTPSTWTYAPITFAANLQSPQNLVLNPVGNGDGQGYAYHYVVTAVNDLTKEESTQSNLVGAVSLLLNTESSQGTYPTNILTWDAVPNATRYNVYKQPPTVANYSTNNILTIWGYAGQSQSTTWTDMNYAPDYSQSPPIHYNPFGGSGFGSIEPETGYASYPFVFVPFPQVLPVITQAQINSLSPQYNWSASEPTLTTLPLSQSPALPYNFTQPIFTIANAPAGAVAPQFSLSPGSNGAQVPEITSPGDGFGTNSYTVTLTEGVQTCSGLVLQTPVLSFSDPQNYAKGGCELQISSFATMIANGGSNFLPAFVLVNPQLPENVQFDATAAINAALNMPNASSLFPESLSQIPAGTTSVPGPYPACYIHELTWYMTIQNGPGSIYPGIQVEFMGCFVVQDGRVVGVDQISGFNAVAEGLPFDQLHSIDPNNFTVTVRTDNQQYGFVVPNAPNFASAYEPTDTFIGQASASTNYPGVCCYFQERAVFAGTSEEPQAVFMSRPGLFTNMDYSSPSEPNDSINITINAQDLSIIQSATPMPSGLILLTGEGAWQITGGGLYQPVTPSSVNAQPQAFSGASYLQPLRINYDLLYVQARGYAVRRLQYNFYFNVYAGTDISVLSAHLFENRQLVEWCYAEQPFYLVWALRDDGILLSLTYLAEQAVEGWARHDTQGYYQSIATVPEGSEDAVYAIVRRSTIINGNPMYYYTTERFASRLLGSNLAQASPGAVEQAWCVDAGVQIEPTIQLTNLFITLTGDGALADASVVTGGANYPATLTATVLDQTGAGSGGQVTVTVTSGAITGIDIVAAGSGYVAPVVVLSPSTGSGASFQLFAQSTCTLSTDGPAFSQPGQIVRASGGKVQITAVDTSQEAIGTIIEPFTEFLPSTAQVAPAFAGYWSVGNAVTLVPLLDHLEGQTVTGLADGVPIQPTQVVDGAITLATPASVVTVGLPYSCQLQTLPLDVPGAGTVQAKRKFLSAATLRVTETEGLTVGSSWSRMTPIKQSGFPKDGPQFAAGGGIQNAPGASGVYGQNPVRYVDERILMGPSWGPNGQVCIQQSNPLPASIVALIPEVTMGDMPG